MMRRAVYSALCAATSWACAGTVYACPMCFSGGDNNQSAFLYGSLFLMVVPVAAIGSLLYWAYRRTRAHESAPPPSPHAPPRPPAVAALRTAARR